MKLKPRYLDEPRLLDKSRMDKSRLRVVFLSLSLSYVTRKKPLEKNGHVNSFGDEKLSHASRSPDFTQQVLPRGLFTVLLDGLSETRYI